MIHNLLRLTLAHNVPVSLRAVPEKYNLIMRLWLHGFHHLLKNLRRCAFNNLIVALEHLQDFIYYTYTFYSCLFEEDNLSFYQSSWVESLGNLARYQMAVSDNLDLPGLECERGKSRWVRDQGQSRLRCARQ